MDETLSPKVLERLVDQGVRLPSFEEASQALHGEGLGLNAKRVERRTEHIGWERVAEREALVKEWEDLRLVDRCQAPPGVDVPEVVSIAPDGGRLQIRTPVEGSTTHWVEYKAGDLRTLKSTEQTGDPCPELPAMFRDRSRIERLVREIGQIPAAGPACSPETETPPAHEPEPPSKDKQPRPGMPEVLTREVIATRENSHEFGRMLIATAWKLGFLTARVKAYLGDGQSWIWKLWETRFKVYGFVPVLDLIHALSYVYGAAMAGRSAEEGWRIYLRWIAWVWEGQVARVIAELEIRHQELGPPQAGDGETHPRKIVADALTYLTNQQTRMNYPEYRRLGLPITSCHIESTIKLLNRRVKGSEKYWSDAGAEALLQLRADLLSDSQPLASFWQRRALRMTGYRVYQRAA